MVLAYFSGFTSLIDFLGVLHEKARVKAERNKIFFIIIVDLIVWLPIYQKKQKSLVIKKLKNTVCLFLRIEKSCYICIRIQEIPDETLKEKWQSTFQVDNALAQDTITWFLFAMGVGQLFAGPLAAHAKQIDRNVWCYVFGKLFHYLSNIRLKIYV